MTQRAFEEMVRQYERLVYTICCQMVQDSAQAEDLAQENVSGGETAPAAPAASDAVQAGSAAHDVPKAPEIQEADPVMP